MRLLFVIDNLGSGGSQRQLVTLANELVRRNHTVEIVVYYEGNHFANDLTDSNIKLHVAKKKWKFSLAPLHKIRKLTRTHSYDAIYAWMTTPNIYSIASQLFLKHKTPVIISEQSGADSITKSFVKKSLFKTYPLADHAVTNSYHMKDYFVKDKKWKDSDVTVIWNGMDLNQFQFTDIEPHYGKRQFIAIGNVSPAKQWTCLIEAMAILRDQYNLEITVNWVARIENLPPVGAAYLQEMNRLVKKHKLEKQWNVLGRRHDVPELISQSVALIHPSTLEGLPNVICEALACGRPVVATNMLDHPRLIQDGKTGFLCEPYSAESLAESIYKICNLEKNELVEMSIKAREFAENNLTVASFGDNFEKLFSKVSNNGNSM